MASPYPILDVHPLSGLTFPWSEAVGSESMSDASFGADGVALGMVMDINFTDLEDAIQQLLGYSYRAAAGKLARVLPFQHPYFNQLWCTRIARVQFRGPIGNETWIDANGVEFGGGTISTWKYARLGLQFTRPPYPILTLTDIRTTGVTQEWERYTDRFWQPSVEVLSREGMSFRYAEGAAGPTGPLGQLTPGSPGQRLGKLRLTRTWYQIPQDGVYNSFGLPSKLFLYTSGATSRPRLGTVNKTEFMGCPAETLLYDAPEITPAPLQMPAYLMGLGAGDSVPQLQYNIKFHFIFFDPPLGPSATTRGHNCMPYSGDGKWYKVYSQNSIDIGLGAANQPPFEPSEFSELFTIL